MGIEEVLKLFASSSVKHPDLTPSHSHPLPETHIARSPGLLPAPSIFYLSALPRTPQLFLNSLPRALEIAKEFAGKCRLTMLEDLVCSLNISWIQV